MPKSGGRERDVGRAARLVSDPRARHFWDEQGDALRAFRAAIPIGTRDAWDVYLVYGPDAKWEGADPPRPRFWMHQLSSLAPTPETPFLDGPTLDAHVKESLPH